MNKLVIAPNYFRCEHMKFPLGRRYCTPEDIKILKKVPPKTAKLYIDGKQINKEVSNARTNRKPKSKKKS